MLSGATVIFCALSSLETTPHTMAPAALRIPPARTPTVPMVRTG